MHRAKCDATAVVWCSIYNDMLLPPQHNSDVTAVGGNGRGTRKKVLSNTWTPDNYLEQTMEGENDNAIWSMY